MIRDCGGYNAGCSVKGLSQSLLKSVEGFLIEQTLSLGNQNSFRKYCFFFKDLYPGSAKMADLFYI